MEKFWRWICEDALDQGLRLQCPQWLGYSTDGSTANIMRDTEDGFLIADEDLRLRGAGEILGTRQSGPPEFKIANLNAHSHLVLTARDDAKLILEKDPELKTERGKNLRVLLYLFERNVAVKFLRSG